MKAEIIAWVLFAVSGAWTVYFALTGELPPDLRRYVKHTPHGPQTTETLSADEMEQFAKHKANFDEYKKHAEALTDLAKKAVRDADMERAERFAGWAAFTFALMIEEFKAMERMVYKHVPIADVLRKPYAYSYTHFTIYGVPMRYRHWEPITSAGQAISGAQMRLLREMETWLSTSEVR